jgi:hypothetical protein
MIIGLEQKLDDQLGYVSAVGKTHLAENEFYANKKYDELDVVCFDNEQFV